MTIPSGLYRVNFPYSGEWRSPFVIELTCRSECLRIPIFDERKLIDRENTILPEVDQALLQTLSDQLLFEEYGGRIAADDPDIDSADAISHDLEVPDDDDDDTTGASRSESYAVPAFVLARRHLAVVDIWADAVKDLSKRQTDDFRRKHLRRDGELLVEAFRRQAERDGVSRPDRSAGRGSSCRRNCDSAQTLSGGVMLPIEPSQSSCAAVAIPVQSGRLHASQR